MPRKKKVEEPVVNEVPKRKPGRPKKSDAAVAAEIEVKKTVRAAGRKVKETAAEAAAAVIQYICRESSFQLLPTKCQSVNNQKSSHKSP